MKQYLELLDKVHNTGNIRPNRTGIETSSLFGSQLRFNLAEGFPAVTTKKLAWKAVVSELLWFLEGSTDERRLAEILYEDKRENLIGKRTIWTDNADSQGKALGYENTDTVKELGKVYGYQWRNFSGVDQIEEIIRQLKEDPYSRRIILNSWNVPNLPVMALPPCHVLAQFYVVDNKLSCQMYQRSVDLFLGAPFNIASYSLLTHILAQICGLEVGEFIWTGGDVHVYGNHIEQVKEQLKRSPSNLPVVKMPVFSSLEELLETKTSDYELVGYIPQAPIKAPMAI